MDEGGTKAQCTNPGANVSFYPALIDMYLFALKASYDSASTNAGGFYDHNSKSP